MMFGVFAFGTAPFGAGPDSWEPVLQVTVAAAPTIFNSRVEDLRRVTLEDMTRTAVHAVALKAWDIAEEEETTLYFADHEFVTQADDTPADRRFVGRLKRVTFERSFVRPAGFGGLVIGNGTIVLDNAEGEFDALGDSYALDGRAFEVRAGRQGDYYEDMVTIFTGTVSVDPHFDRREVAITVKDKSTLFDKPLVTISFAGTGGVEGGEDLFLKRNPFVVGEATNFTPPLVWSQKNIYMLNGPDFSNFGVFTFFVYMNGVELDFYNFYHLGNSADPLASLSNDVNEPPSGWFTAAVDEAGDDSGIYLRIGVVPDNQIVTASLSLVRGLGDMAEVDVATKAASVADMAWLATTLTWPDDFDVAAFYTHHAQQPYAVGLWFDQNSTATLGEGIEQMCGEASFVGFTGEGKLTIGAVTGGLTGAALDLDQTNILEIERERLPNGLTPPVWKWKLGWLRNWTNMEGRVAGSVGEIERAFFNEPLRIAGYQNSGLLTAHPTARERESLDTMFVDFVDAATEAERLYNLYNSDRRLYRIRTSQVGLLATFGEVILLTYDRFGLDDGRLGRVVSDAYDSGGSDELATVTLQVFA